MRIVVLGAGNAGCFTALHYSWYTRDSDTEVELIYDPSIQPERVGQATLTEQPNLLWEATGFDWYTNKIHATFKSGILYEGWGKHDKWFHPFPAGSMAMHYCPWEMQKSVLESGRFKVTEGSVTPSDIDADYIFDCRGKPDDFSDYDVLDNPVNAVILGKPNWDMSDQHWSRHVATPNGWTFVIPTHPDSPSHQYCVGYCYNTDITSKEDAEKNFLEMFDVSVTKHQSFKSYVAKNPVIDDRIYLNGNRLFFLEPLESSSVHTYLRWARVSFDKIIQKSQGVCDFTEYIKKTHNFILWHYQAGSKYDSPFWDYSKKFTFTDPEFDICLDYVKKTKDEELLPSFSPIYYAQWHAYSIKNWYNNGH